MKYDSEAPIIGDRRSNWSVIKKLGIVMIAATIIMMLIWRLQLKNIVVNVSGSTRNIKSYYIVMCVLIVIGLLLACIWLTGRSSKWFTHKFLISILLIGFINNLILVPFSAPDELIHFAQSYEISNKILGVERDENDLRIPLEEGQMVWLFDAKEGIEKTIQFYEHKEKDNEEPILEESFARSGNIALYPYIPAGIGIAIGRVLHLPYQAMMIMGRMFNLLFLSFVAIAAMTIYKPMRYAIAGICLLPATIGLSAAYTYDVWNLAGILLFVSLCLRIRQREGNLRIRDILLLALLFVAYVPIKYVYGILGLCVLLIPSKKWNKKFIVGILGVAFAALFVILLTRGQEIAGLLLTNQMDERGRGSAEAVSYTVGYLINYPVEVLQVFGKTAITQTATFVFNSAIGEVMGARYPYVPSFIAAFIIIVFIALMAMPIHHNEWTGRERRIAIGIMLGGIAAIYLVFLFSYSVINEDGIGIVAGIQGRYFTPFYILLPIIMQSKSAYKIVAQIKDGICQQKNGICVEEWLVASLVLLNVVELYCKLIGIATI